MTKKNLIESLPLGGIMEAFETLNTIAEYKTGTTPPIPDTVFKKYDDGKPRTDLLPPVALLKVAEVCRFGAEIKGYGDNNWNKCEQPNRYTAAGLRHTFKDLAAQLYPDLFSDMDEEAKDIEHLACACCSLLFELELKLIRKLRKAKLEGK